jgi:aryl-alcohol dehydrogenase-like predicted oxidoreductase
VSPDELEVALGMTDIVSVQNRFNVLERENEDVLRMCEQNGIAFISYFPLAGGKLIKPGNPLTEIAQKYSVSTSQIAIAWLLKFSKFILPIPGTSSIEHLRDNIAATDIELSDADMAELNNL